MLTVWGGQSMVKCRLSGRVNASVDLVVLFIVYGGDQSMVQDETGLLGRVKDYCSLNMLRLV